MRVPPSGEIKSAPDAAELHLICGCLEFKDYESSLNLLSCLIVWILRDKVHYRYGRSG